MSDNPKYCVFILTHGRAKNVITYKTLKRCGYSGDIYFVIDSDDKQGELYKREFGEDRVCVFNKSDYDGDDGYDSVDNFDEKRCIWFARNACFDIAEKLGYEYFIELDDDYDNFSYAFDEKGYCNSKYWIKSLDKVFEEMVRYFHETPQMASLAMAQGGDYIGGANGSFGNKIQLRRKCMNSFICSVKRRFKFIGRINEDVNTYTSEGQRGMLFFTTSQLRLNQKETQKNSGGMTGSYISLGTYVKSFYTVIVSPSCTSVRLMGEHSRLHHNISWNNCAPKIMHEKWRTERL